MKWIPSFLRRKPKQVDIPSRKSGFPLGAFVDYLESYGHSDLASYAAIGLWNVTPPLFNAIDMIADKVSSLTLVLKRNDGEEISKEHPVLELLSKPNTDVSGDDFLYQCTAFFLITGNMYQVATGQPDREPLELFCRYPQSFQAIESPRDGFAEAYDYQSRNDSLRFVRNESKDGWRFLYRDEAEAWHVKRFNPNVNALYGQALSTSLLAEIDQYNLSASHNVSLLKRGARPSGILLASGGLDREGQPVDGLTDEQYNRLRSQLGRFMGAENAGKVFIADGVNVDYKDMIVSNRDMDWLEGKKDVRKSIYNHFKIPLPLIESGVQTFSNLSVSDEQLYDNAVLPTASYILGKQTQALRPRYKDLNDWFLTYDESKIPALQRRKARELKEKRDAGIYTINELRTDAGKEELAEGGDVLYQPANLVAIGRDAFTDDNLTTPN